MNKPSAFAVLVLLCGSPAMAQGQFPGSGPGESGGAYPIGRNDAAHPCVTDEQYDAIARQCAENIRALGLDNAGRKNAAGTLFSWPLRTAPGLNDCSYYGIGAYVDQDTTSGIKDFNCGTNTYDGHKGTDIFIWPFPFYKMDHDQIEIIAAAPGTIVNRVDGNFDKNCASNSLTPNYIVVQHADGSMALYLHMKSGSLTSKAIGQTVTTGEFLGRVGSSGSSTGPHLHFEVWSGSTVATRKDPYSGSCNTLNSASWWASQKPYKDPAVVKASVHMPGPVFPPCPATETPNEDTCFMPGASVVFATFLRDETSGLTANMSVLDPGGATVFSWIHNSTSGYNGSYWTFNRTLPAIPGLYTFKAVYNGKTCTQNFKIDCKAIAAGIVPANGLPEFSITPNPANDLLHISAAVAENGTYSFVLKDPLGRVVSADKIAVSNHLLQKTFSTAALPDGVYFLSIEWGTSRMIKKIVKQD